MVKRKESCFRNWEDVNTAMQELGALTAEKQKQEGNQTLRINELKAYYQEKYGYLATRIKEIEKNIERFANQNKHEFAKTRTKRLSYGSVSYRVTKRVACRSAESAINALKALNLDCFIRTKEELNKDEIICCQDKDTLQSLAKADITVVSEDKIKIEPDIAELLAVEDKE